MTKYKAKPDTWFDDGTIVELIDDYRSTTPAIPNCGLFRGYKDGKLDEELCDFDEFEEIEDEEKTLPENRMSKAI
jgi:hypothetical protein